MVENSGDEMMDILGQANEVNNSSEKEAEEKSEKEREELFEKRKEMEAQAERNRKAEEIEMKAAEKNAKMNMAAAAASAIPEVGPIAGAALEVKAGKDQKEASEKASEAKKPSLASKLKKGYDYTNKSFMGAQDKASQAIHHAHPWLFFLILLAVHGYDAINGFARNNSNGFVMATLYVVVTLWAMFFYYKTDFSQESLQFWIVSAIAFALPLLISIPFLNRLRGSLALLLFFTPVWALFMSNKEEGSVYNIGRLYLIFWFIIALIFLLANFAMPDLLANQGLNIGNPLRDFTSQLGDAFSKVKEKLIVAVNPGAIKSKLNQTFNPYAKYYTGQVEQNKREPLGVYIENLRSLTQKTYVNEQPMVVADLVGKSFLDNTVFITPSCRLEKNNAEQFGGQADPAEPIDMNYKLQRTVTCTYPKINQTGYYDAVLGASFDFETWAYITYTFVDLKTIRAYYKQEKDINQELDIETRPVAIYTSGPVSIGVSTNNQPIDVNTEAKHPKDAIKQNFGFTIGDIWQQGSIREVKEVSVLIPDPFVIEDCKPIAFSGPVVDENSGMNKYTFSKKAFGDNSKQDLRTVTCKLILPNQDAINEIVSFGSKTPVTFVVTAKYNYLLEKKTKIKVEE